MRKKKHGFRRPVVIKKPKQPLEQPSVDPITGKKIPKSFVFSRGKLPGPLRQLQMDLRKLMLPYTALSLREKKRNNLRDFLNVAGPMGVTHFLILSKTATAPYLRVATTPQGPTLTFKIHEYSLAADIARSQLHPRCPKDLFKNSALIVLSGFVSRDLHLQLTTNMFQNIFPTIDVKTVKLSSCQRIVLLNYNKDTKFIDFRHYSIRLQPVGVSRRISKLVQSHQVPDLKNLQDVAVERKTHLLNYNKDTKFIDFRHYSIRLQPVGVSRRISKLVQSHQVPDLKNLQDVSDFVTKAGYGSESEADEEAATVTLSSNLGRVNRASTKSAVKLQEIGPRMTLQLVKVEKGLCSGEVLFSEYGKAGDKGKSDDEMQDNEDGEDSEGSEDEDEDEGGEDPEDGEDDEELD